MKVQLGSQDCIIDWSIVASKASYTQKPGHLSGYQQNPDYWPCDTHTPYNLTKLYTSTNRINLESQALSYAFAALVWVTTTQGFQGSAYFA